MTRFQMKRMAEESLSKEKESNKTQNKTKKLFKF